MDTTELSIKSWNDLTYDELRKMNKNHAREWHISGMTKRNHGNNIFFLLKGSNNVILAQGQLVPIHNVLFNGESFTIYGIGGIIANVKGKGYGKKIMLAIKNYLQTHKKSEVGFTGLSGFYEACGFLVRNDVIKRFVYIEGTHKVINTESDKVCYWDSEDAFMEKVLNNTSHEVLLPREPNW